MYFQKLFKNLDHCWGASPQKHLFASFFLLFVPFLHFSCKNGEKSIFWPVFGVRSIPKTGQNIQQWMSVRWRVKLTQNLSLSVGICLVGLSLFLAGATWTATLSRFCCFRLPTWASRSSWARLRAGFCPYAWLKI